MRKLIVFTRMFTQSTGTEEKKEETSEFIFLGASLRIKCILIIETA